MYLYVGYLVGSLAEASVKRQLAHALMKLALRELEFDCASASEEFLRKYMEELHAFITRVYTAFRAMPQLPRSTAHGDPDE